MSEENAVPDEVRAAAPPAADDDVAEGKPLAVLSYALALAFSPFFILPLLLRNNDFALYHAKQCLLLSLFGSIAAAAGAALWVVCIGIVILPAAVIVYWVFAVIGLINAMHGQKTPLPFVGKWAEDWFRGIRKV